jgi:hypothetical protein
MQMEILSVAGPLAGPVLGGIVRPPRWRPTRPIPERVHRGSRVARAHVDLDEVLALELAPVGRQRDYVARCSSRREEPEQPREADRAGVELDSPNVAVVDVYV